MQFTLFKCFHILSIFSPYKGSEREADYTDVAWALPVTVLKNIFNALTHLKYS